MISRLDFKASFLFLFFPRFYVIFLLWMLGFLSFFFPESDERRVLVVYVFRWGQVVFPGAGAGAVRVRCRCGAVP